MKRYDYRPGISLMEVLFAIGVIAIGLLGVMAVMPIALDQVGKGERVGSRSSIGSKCGGGVLFARHVSHQPMDAAFGPTTGSTSGDSLGKIGGTWWNLLH